MSEGVTWAEALFSKKHILYCHGTKKGSAEISAEPLFLLFVMSVWLNSLDFNYAVGDSF